MERWNSERLDDRFADITRRLDHLEHVADTMTGLREKVIELAEDARGCRDGQRKLEMALEKRALERAEERVHAFKQREQEQRAAKAEKTKDRRWIIGTLLATGTLIVGAFAVLVSVLPT